jgi:hypothetical protein
MRAAAACWTLFAAACAAHLETRALDPSTGRPDSTKGALEGVVYYQPQYMKVTHVFTELVDKDGKLVGSAEDKDKKCDPVIEKEEIQIMPNYEQPYVIRQTAGFLNGNKFGVTLENGVLTGVNTETATKAPDLITAIPSLVQAVGGLGHAQALPPEYRDTTKAKRPALLACNAGPRITDFRPYPPKQ